MRTCSSSSSSSPGGIASGVTRLSTENASSAKSARALPVVVVDTQETRIRLVHALLACPEAVQQENFKAANALVKEISMLAATQGGPMRKVAGYFAEAIARRIYCRCPRPGLDCAALDSPALDNLLHMHFYKSCPYLKPPQADHSNALQQVGYKLAVLAKNIGIEFQFRGFVAASLANLEPRMLLKLESGNKGDRGNDGEEEAVAVNFVIELHRLLARLGVVKKVLGTVRALRSRIVTVVEEEANHNRRTFLERFTEALHYYSNMFDSLESGEAETAETAEGEMVSAAEEQQQHRAMAEAYLGRQICNVVACEGTERTK
ncbi:hypothetical protein Cni_G12739 [Canna indica]|uniref:DELLA protein n=1 Tax=Canna indica TaxID=4628 RepID=A0AAQ3QCF6_9LILI|nr:hypothetical protein Cni_G12739 [Canna indica]